MSLVLAQRTIKAHPNGFVGAIVEGKRGVGKSSYCIKVQKEVYQDLYDLSDTDAYNMALKYTVFEIDEIITLCKEARKQKKMIPCLTWDDAGVGGSNIQWFINMHGVQQLRAFTETIRTALTGFLINCTSRQGLLKHIREQDDFVVEIIKTSGDGWSREARGYNMFKLPSGTVRVYRSFADKYSCYLPKWVYEEYTPVREAYLDRALSEMEEMKKRLGRPKIN